MGALILPADFQIKQAKNLLLILPRKIWDGIKTVIPNFAAQKKSAMSSKVGRKIRIFQLDCWRQGENLV